MRTPRSPLRSAAACAALALLAACTPAESLSTSQPEADAGDAPEAEDTAEPGTGGEAGDGELVERIEALEVAPETAQDTYDRDAFGEYDRQAALEENREDWPGCDGYFSPYDDECYDDADEVDVDEMVARAEAWRSGADAWDEERLDAFGQDPRNLVLMTSRLNQQDKSDHDISEWTPEFRECEYLEAHLTVKDAYGLTVDQTEREAMLTQAADCA